VENISVKTILKLCAILLLPALLPGCGEEAREPSTGLTLFTEESPPMSFMRDGELTGLAVEAVGALMRHTGTAGDIRLTEWPDAYKAALATPDAAVFPTVMTAERKGLFQWVGPIVSLETGLYAIRGSDIRIARLADARQARAIATVTGYYSEQVLQSEGGLTNLRSYPDEPAALQALLAGEVELMVGNSLTMAGSLEKVGARTHDIQHLFTVSTDLGYVAFSMGTSPALVAQWQAALNAMKRDGSFAEIHGRWLPAETPPGEFQLVTEEYPPITFMRDGRASGFVTDMVREIAGRQGLSNFVKLTTWKNAYGLALLHPNVVLFSAERTEAREDLFHWVGPVGRNRAIFFARSGSGIQVDSLDDARNMEAIATTTDWFTEQYLQAEGFTNLISSANPVENVRRLMDGGAQLSIFTDLTIPEIVADAGYTMDDLEAVYTVSETDFYIALSRDTPPDAVEQWRAGLDELKADGIFEAIYTRYLPHADLDDLLGQ
jgi:ABC-type amino acid transport substrate-binding protein